MCLYFLKKIHMIPIWSLQPAATSSHTPKPESISSGEHPSKDTPSLLSPQPRRLRKKLREVPSQNKGSSGVGSSPLHLEHAFKEARPNVSSFIHLRENDKDLQEAFKSHCNASSSRQILTRHAREWCPTRKEPPRQWWYHTTSLCCKEERLWWESVSLTKPQ